MFMERRGLKRAGEARLKKVKRVGVLLQAIPAKATGNVVLSNHHTGQKAVWKTGEPAEGPAQVSILLWTHYLICMVIYAQLSMAYCLWSLATTLFAEPLSTFFLSVECPKEKWGYLMTV